MKPHVNKLGEPVLTPKTKSLLLKVRDHVLQEPKRLDMDRWAAVFPVSDVLGDIPDCHTTGCIAGWSILLSGPKKKWKEMQNRANEGRVIVELNGGMGCSPERDSFRIGRDILHLTDSQASRLFYASHSLSYRGDRWPSRFINRYQKATTPRTRAKVTAERIEHFIKTEGAE